MSLCMKIGVKGQVFHWKLFKLQFVCVHSEDIAKHRCKCSTVVKM